MQAIGAMQLMLDRGQDQDWFTSREIITEAVFAGLGFYLFLVHIVSAREPLIRLAVFGDADLTGPDDDVHGRCADGVEPRADDPLASGTEQLSGGDCREDHGATRSAAL